MKATKRPAIPFIVSKTNVTLPVSLEPEKYKLTVRATPADSTVQLENSKIKYYPGMEVTPWAL